MLCRSKKNRNVKGTVAFLDSTPPPMPSFLAMDVLHTCDRAPKTGRWTCQQLTGNPNQPSHEGVHDFSQVVKKISNPTPTPTPLSKFINHPRGASHAGGFSLQNKLAGMDGKRNCTHVLEYTPCFPHTHPFEWHLAVLLLEQVLRRGTTAPTSHWHQGVWHAEDAKRTPGKTIFHLIADGHSSLVGPDNLLESGRTMSPLSLRFFSPLWCREDCKLS
ncbi:hypothetical protein VFPPC_09891 [Pochonia chlamydosporia 170]|uniref:Uncharacterized protein n=1 Tax=Pochonia chlamydosporia 170 TaxID=1380566 RepID=A0A179FDH5_METCM|nr:hypothetical protein VFPPC_09891 [Pochonia chlamydosporia 170]OAQ63408.1 hypothetical protein VFPPC_09891 [Pochonia chlamydosporia 170]